MNRLIHTFGLKNGLKSISWKICLWLNIFFNQFSEKGGCRPHRMDDEFLKKFLRARFWKVDNAYKLMCRYYQFRAQNTQFYLGVHPIKLRSLGDEEIVSVPPYRDQDGRRLIIYKIGNWRPSKVPVEDIFRATLLIMEVGSLEPQNQVLGSVGIFDLDGLAMNHAWQMTPTYAQKVIQLLVVSDITCFVYFWEKSQILSNLFISHTCQFESVPYTLSTRDGSLTPYFSFSSHSWMIGCAKRFSFMDLIWNRYTSTSNRHDCLWGEFSYQMRFKYKTICFTF